MIRKMGFDNRQQYNKTYQAERAIKMWLSEKRIEALKLPTP